MEQNKVKSLPALFKSSIKFQVNVTLASILIIFSGLLTYITYSTIKKQIENDTERVMISHLNDLSTILESQVKSRQNAVNLAIKLANNILYETGGIVETNEFLEIEGVNQNTGKLGRYSVQKWMLDGKQLYSNTDVVDHIKSQSVETATIFQKIKDGYLRISTNVKKSDGKRAIGTYIPNSSEVIKTIEKGETYIGRAFVVNNWYLTAYKPIWINGKIQGILYVGMKEKDYEFLKKVLGNKKYFDNGYPFLVSDKGELIIHPTKEGANFSHAQFFKQLTNKDGQVGRSEYLWPENEEGKKKIQYYKYFEPYESFISTSIYKDDMHKGLNYLVSVTSILILAFAVLIYFALSTYLKPIINQLRYMAYNAKEVASGNLTLNIESNRQDEIGVLANSLNSMISNLKRVVNEIANGAQQLNASGVQFDSSSQDFSQGANEQASSIEEVSSTVEEISASVDQNTKNAKETDEISTKVATEIESVGKKALNAQKICNVISEKIKIINDIAYKTSILSINAAIEAAKAGEQGRGFGVVAANVGTLAEKCNEAANEIVDLVSQSVLLTQNAEQSLQEIIPDIKKTSDLVKKITEGGNELSIGIHQINNALQQINITTVQNAAGSEELASSAKELTSQSDSLMKLISYFKTDEKYIHAQKEFSVNDLLNNDIREQKEQNKSSKDLITDSENKKDEYDIY